MAKAAEGVIPFSTDSLIHKTDFSNNFTSYLSLPFHAVIKKSVLH